MKSKKLKYLYLLLIMVSILISSCNTNRGCSGMKYHNSDVKRGLAH